VRSPGLRFNGVRYGFGEGVDVLFGGVERAHPADNGFFFDPHIKKILLHDLIDGGPGDLRKDAIGFDGPHDSESWDAAEFPFEKAGHAVGMLGVASPEIAGQERLELHRDKAHLGCQLHPLLAQVEEIAGECGVKENDSFPPQDTVFGAAERKDVHAEIARGLAQGLSESNGGVGNAGTVHVQEHVSIVCEVGESTNLVRLVDRAHLGRLRYGDNARLDVMLVPETMTGMVDGFHTDLPVLMWQRDQLAAGMLFGSGTLIGVNVRVVAAEDSVVGAIESLQSKDIRGGSVEGEEDLDTAAKMLFKFTDRRPGVGIVTIGDDVSLIHAGQRFKDVGMNSGVVITREATC